MTRERSEYSDDSILATPCLSMLKNTKGATLCNYECTPRLQEAMKILKGSEEKTKAVLRIAEDYVRQLKMHV